MDAEKSRDLQSAGWVLVTHEGWCFSSSLKAWKPGEALAKVPKAHRFKNQEPMFHFKSKERKKLMSQLKAVREGCLLTMEINIFVQFRPSADWIGPTTLGRTISFTQTLYSNVNLTQKPLTDTPRVTFDKMSQHHVAPSSGRIKSTLTSIILIWKEKGDGGWVEPRNVEFKTQKIHDILVSSRKQDEIIRFYRILRRVHRGRWQLTALWKKQDMDFLRRIKFLMMNINITV